MAGFEGEEELVAWLRERLPRVGDDAASVRFEHPLAITTDSQVEGVHFPPGLNAALIARRLVRVNLSDLAASGAEPLCATCCVVGPQDFDLRGFFAALIEECQRYGVELIGGDTTRSPTTSCSLTLFGETTVGQMLQRSAARAGDVVWHSGELGHAALGWRLQQLGARLSVDGVADLRAVQALAGSGLTNEILHAAQSCVLSHRLPGPRIELGRQLQEISRNHRVATIDISDGLLKDAGRLAVASAVGIELERSALEPTGAFRTLCQVLGEPSWSHTVSGGEDYELLFTLPEGVDPPPDCRRVGRTIGETDRRGRVWFDRRPNELGDRTEGWDHLRPGSAR